MNWVGGTRNRIRTQNGKRLQREFFERKKFADKVQVYRSIGATGIRKQGLGQDLRAFQTVNIAHSNKKGIESCFRPVKKVDMDVSKPAISRMVEDIDLGPTSPSSGISKINLMEPKYEKRQTISDDHSVFSKAEKQPAVKTNYKSNILTFEPFSSPNPYKFKKPEPILKQNLKDFGRDVSKKFGHKDMEPEITDCLTPKLQSFCETSVTGKSNSKSVFSEKTKQNLPLEMSKGRQRDMSYLQHTDCSRKMLDENYSSNFPAKQPSKVFDVHFNEEINISTFSTKRSHKRPFKEKHTKLPKVSTKNLFISEDFQITPLRNYQQKPISPSTHSFNKNDQIEQNDESLPSHIDLLDRVFSSADFIETPLKRRKFSTPVLYPKTSTPKSLTQTSLHSDDTLTKTLQNPDIKSLDMLIDRNLFSGDTKECYHMADTSMYSEINKQKQLENFDFYSPREESTFSDIKFKEMTSCNPSGKILNSTAFTKKIELKESPVESTRPVDNTDTSTQNTVRHMKNTDSKMEEVLAEITELEKQDFQDEMFEENDCDYKEYWKCITKETKNKSVETKEMDADSKQELVNRDVVTRVLNEIVSKIENVDNISPGNDLQQSSLYDPTCEDVIKAFEVLEYSSECEFKDMPNSPLQYPAGNMAVTCTSETQTDEKVFVDSSTSPISSINFTEEKSIQCSISRGISPPCYHDQNENNLSISEDLRVIPMKFCSVVCLHSENKDFIGMEQDVQTDAYCLRSRKLYKENTSLEKDLN